MEKTLLFYDTESKRYGYYCHRFNCAGGLIVLCLSKKILVEDMIRERRKFSPPFDPISGKPEKNWRDEDSSSIIPAGKEFEDEVRDTLNLKRRE